MKLYLFLVLFLLFSGAIKLLSKEDTLAVKKDRANSPNVYFDCSFCDFEHLKKEINFINFVYNASDARLIVLGFSSPTGGGGKDYVLTLSGTNGWEGMRDTVSVQVKADASSDERREAYTKLLKLALVRYALKTPAGATLNLTQDNSTDEEIIDDKWDSWVFRLSANLYASGQTTYNELNYWGSASASRITKEWKHDFYLSASYDEEFYKIDDTTKISSFSRSNSFNAKSIKSIGEHFSAGLFAGYNSSIYSNYKFRAALKPALEYNIFHYSKSNYKQIRISYKAGYSYNKYLDTNVYDKLNEGFAEHEFNIASVFKQTWGTLDLSINASQVLPDFPKVNFYFYSGLSIRIYQGLSLSLSGSLNLINSQRSLSKSSASYEDIILRNKQLPTEYSYWTSAGLSYTFGSIYNNVVNPRFGY